MLNKILIHGRLTKDPELRKTPSDISMLIFTVAWSDKYKEVEKKCFLTCKAWRHTADFISTYFRKGQEIIIEGQMITEEWKDNEKVTFCLVDKADLCGPKRNSTPEPEPEPKTDKDGFMAVPDDIDEELPFS